ncbi:hypothetical protein, partial [Enterobacter hormaechei]|uniref:hypothetical protein n=1 Tax=Enterobacter hormaechei TaxID=158836 RepID=UPI0037545991
MTRALLAAFRAPGSTSPLEATAAQCHMSFAFHRMRARAVACGAFLVLSMTATAQDSLEIATLDNSAMGPLAISVLRQAYG